MEQIRREILPGVYLTCLRTDKFKTGTLSVTLLTRLCRENAAKNALLPHVLRRGTTHYPDMDALAARMDDLYGAAVEPVVRKLGEMQAVGFAASFADDRFIPGGGTLLEDVAELTGEMLLRPDTRGGLFLPQTVESEKEKLLEDIRARLNDKIAFSRTRLTELMCVTEDYAADAIGDEEQAEAIGYVSLSKHYRELLATAPVEIFYVGSADAARIEAAMHTALLTLPRGALDTDIGTDIRMNTLEDETRYFTDIMDVGQGKLCLGFRLGACMEDPDVAALRVLNAVYGGCVSSKLFLNVRERLSLCYFASSGVDILKGVMFVVSGIEFDKYDEALEEIFAQLEAIKRGDITPEELSTAKAAVRSALLAAADSGGALESFWLGQNAQGLSYGPEELAALVDEVTGEDVVRAAQGIVCDAVYFLKNDEDGEAEYDAEN